MLSVPSNNGLSRQASTDSTPSTTGAKKTDPSASRRVDATLTAEARRQELADVLNKWVESEPSNLQHDARAFAADVLKSIEASVGPEGADWQFESAYAGNLPAIPPHLKVTLTAVGPPPEDLQALDGLDPVPVSFLAANLIHVTPRDMSALASTSVSSGRTVQQIATVTPATYRPGALNKLGLTVVRDLDTFNVSWLKSTADHFFAAARSGEFRPDEVMSVTIDVANGLINEMTRQRQNPTPRTHALLKILEACSECIGNAQTKGGVTKEGAAIQKKIASFAKDVREEEAVKLKQEIAATKQLRAAKRLDELDRFSEQLGAKLRQFSTGEIGSRSLAGGAFRTPLEREMTQILGAIAALPPSEEKQQVLDKVVRTLNSIPTTNPKDAQRFANTMLTKVLPRLLNNQD